MKNQNPENKSTLILGLLLAAASGAALTAAFPPYEISWMAWVGLVPLFVALLRFAPTDRRFGALFAVAMTVWFFGMLRNIPDGYEAIYAVPVLGFFFFYFITMRLRRFVTAGDNRWFTAIMATGIVGFEYLRQFLPSAQFATLGMSQFRHPELIQTAAWFGVAGISLQIVLVNCVLALVIASAGSPGKNKFQIIAGVAVIAALFGLNRHLMNHPIHNKGTVRAAAVQFGFVPEEKNHGALQPLFETYMKKNPVKTTEKTLDILASLTRGAAAKGAQIVIWPEVILNVDPARYPDMRKQISDLAVEIKAYIVAPYSSVKEKDWKQANPPSLNAAWVVAPNGKFVFHYVKQHRVTALGIEKGPQGRVTKPLTTPLGKLGLLICYDTDYPDLSTLHVRRGAEIFVVPSHDLAEFVTRHHPYLVMFRAIEHRRSFVKADYVNGALIVDPYGKILDDPADGLGFAIADVPVTDTRTRFPFLSPVFGIGMCVMFVAFLIVAGKEREE